MYKPSDPRELAIDLLPRSICAVQVAAVVCSAGGDIISGAGTRSAQALDCMRRCMRFPGPTRPDSGMERSTWPHSGEGIRSQSSRSHVQTVLAPSGSGRSGMWCTVPLMWHGYAPDSVTNAGPRFPHGTEKARVRVVTRKAGRLQMDKKVTSRVTSRNLLAVMDRLKQYAATTYDEERQAFCDDLNRFLDELADQDAFGTEGQLDPRGDQRG